MQSTYLYGYGTTDDEEEIYQPQSHILNARDSKLEVDTKKETPTLQGKLSEQAPEQNPIGIPISPEEWTYISRASAVAENPEEELNRYAAALTFSREYGIDVVSAMNNLDDLTLYQIGQKFTPTKTAAQAIFNSAAYGAMNTFKLNPLKEDFRAIDSAGGDTSQILDEIKVYESKLESLQDNTPRGWITELLKLSGQTASYSFQIAGEGIKFSAIAGISLAALAAASGLTVVTGGLAAPLTGAVAIGGGMAVAGAYGRYKKGSESAAAILYYELRKNGVDKDIANKAADIHGIISGAVESIFDQVGGALLPGIVGNTAAGAIANRVTSKIAVSGSLGTFVQSVTKYLSGAVGEGVEEFTQSLSESITSEVAYEMSGVIPPGRSMSIIEQAVTEAVQGFAVGMVLGGVEIPGMIKGAKVDVGKAASIRELAKNIPSKEFFVKAMETQKPEAATGRDWNDAMVKVWEKAQQSNKSSVLESDETAINELDTRGGGDPTGTVRRMETGELYTQERQKVKVVKAKNVITNPYDPHAEAERADMSRRATETPTEEVGNGINADTASVGDTITLYLPNGATEELTVTARSESGTLKVKNKKGEEHIVEDGSYSFKDPKDLDYEIDTIEGSPKISEMDDATIIQVKKRLKEKIEAQKKVGNTESALYFMRDLNALTFEQKRRDSAATTDTDGRELHTLNVGDPVTGNRYGFIDYTLNENTIEIEDVKVSPGYEGIRKEMVLDLINKHQGYDVSWDAKGENLQGIKDEIINENPRGADAGLQYYDGITNVDERVELEKEIGKVFPNMNSSEKALAATLLQLRAEAKGMTTRGYLNTYSGVGGLFQNAKEAGMELNPSQKGAISLKDTESGVKAVIYAGEKGDFSTFSHELFHLISKETGQRDQLREVFDEVSRTEEFEKFINTYRSMFSDEVFKGKSAKQIAKIMQDWSEDGTWTRSQDEVIARVWEAYLLNGETASPKLKSIFKRIADWMSKIYTMIKGRAKLDERIVKRFDELLENDKSPITNTQEITAAQTLNQVSAYHGSPHSFDKFATSAMGTGEGAQAFEQIRFQVMEEAIADKGATTDLREAGYVLPDGTMLDFSAKKYGNTPGERIEDHRDIDIPSLGDLDGTDLMIAFQKAGALRIDANTGLVDAEVMPTSKQLSIIDDIMAINGFVVVDLADGNRKTSFESEASPAKVKGAIRRFYNGGEIDQERIRFQVAPATDTPAFKDWFGDSKVVDENGEPLVVYHGTKRDFDTFQSAYPDGLIFFTKDSDFAATWPSGTGGFREASDEVKAASVEARAFERDLGNQLLTEDILEGIGTDEGNAVYDAVRADIRAQMKAKFGYESGFDIEAKADIRVMPVYLSIQNPFDPSKDWASIEPVLRGMTSMEGIIEAGHHRTGNWVVYENVEVINAIKDMGYDGVYLQESTGGPSDTIAVFEPTQIKSVNNRGTFDPNNPDIRLQTIFDNKSLDFYQGVEYVKHDEGYKYEEKDIREIDENVQEQFDLFDPEEIDPLSMSAARSRAGEVLPNQTSNVQSDWKHLKRIDYTGRSIRSSKELAELFSIYRNSSLEFFHIIYTDDNNKILAHNVMSSGIPGATIAAEGRTSQQSFYKVRSRMSRIGAAGYYLMHNHPTGNIEPSREDINLTRNYDKNVEGFKGHVILDHDRFTVLSATQDKENIAAEEILYSPHYVEAKKLLSEEKILSEDTLKKYVSKYMTDRDNSLYFIMNNRLMIIEARPVNEPSFISAYEAMRSVGGSSVMLITPSETHFRSMLEDGKTMQNSKYGVFTEMLYVGENGHTDSFMSNVGANPYWQTYALNAERDKSTSNYVWEKPTYHITDKKKKQILSEAANEKMLFQTDITPDILESAKEFDSWEDFRAEYIVEAGFDFTVELPNDQWYKDVFNQAHGIVKEEARPDKVRLESEQQKDGYFADVIEDDDKLDEFMSELGYILTYTGNNENPSDQGELDDINRRLDLQNRIDTEVHPTIRSNAIRKNSGKEITDRSKQAIKTLIGGGSLRYYRDLYADVMNDTELKPEVIDSRLADIEDMIPDDFDTLSITNRIRLADTLVNKKLKEKILSGEETFDGEAEKVVRQMDKDIAKIEGQIEKAEAEISEKDAQLSDQDKKISALYNDLNQANNDIEKILKKVRSRSDADPKYLISEEDMKQRRTLSKKIENLDSQIKKYRTSEQVKATVKRHEALQKLKEKLDEKKVNRDEGVKTRALKIKYVRAIMIKPSKAVDVAYRKKIFAIQAQIDPAFRRSKIHLAREVGEDETLTLEETKIKLRGATEEELRGVLGDKAYERLSGLRKPLNDWTVEELRQIADEVYTLRSEGIDIWSAKEERLRMIAGGYQTALISKLISMKRYKPKKIPGTAESDKDRRSFKNGVLSAYYAVYNMVDKAMMLDGGTEGAMFNLLVRDKRRLQSSEWANKERRLAPIINIMKEVGINQVDWYKTAEIGIDGKKYNMTYSSLAYYFLSQFNEDNYQAIAYGTLLTQAEKKGLNFNDDEITEVGMRRYAQVIGQATEILTNTERGKKVYQVMEVIRDTLNNEEDKRRIQDVLIREYNDEMREVGDYLPIHRVGVTYDDLAQNVAADFYNMNAGGAATSVEQGFKTTRINISPAHQSAVNTDLFGVVYRSISEQEHMIAFAEYGRNLNRIFKNPGSKLTQEVITQTFGKAMLDDVHDYINEVINPDSFEQLKSVDKLLRAARGNLGAAYLGWKTSALVLQAITSPMPYLSEMSIPRLAKSYLHIAANNPLKVWDFIAGKSQMMKNRSANVVIDLILKQSKEYTSNKAARGLKKGQEIGTEGLVWVDRISVMGGWLGSYNKKLEELAKEGIPREIADKKAVEYADEVALRVQPTGDKTELSPLFKAGGEAVKAFTQFQTALNVIFRNLTYEAPVMAKNAFNKELPNEVRKSEALRFLGTLSGYMFAGALLGAVMEGHDEDDETGDKVKNWLYWSTTQFTGSIPLIGDMIDANIEGMVKEETPYYFNDDMLPALNNILRGTGDLTQGKYEKAMRKIGKGIGLGLGLPVSGTKELEEVFTSEGLGAFIGRRDWK